MVKIIYNLVMKGERIMKLIQEFKEFAFKGNVMDSKRERR